TTVNATLLPSTAGFFSVVAATDYHLSGAYSMAISITNADGVQTTFHTTAAVSPGPNELYANKLYKDLLGRDPESEGLTHWTAALDAGMAHDAVVQAITNSAEYRG